MGLISHWFWLFGVLCFLCDCYSTCGFLCCLALRLTCWLVVGYCVCLFDWFLFAIVISFAHLILLFWVASRFGLGLAWVTVSCFVVCLLFGL